MIPIPAAAAPTVAGTVPTPAGPLSVVATADGVVRAAGFTTLESLVERLHASALGQVEVRQVPATALPATVRAAVRRYADGDLGALDEVAVAQPGGAFFQDVWLAMRRIPPGGTVSYAALAVMASRPAAVRAAAMACARNLVAPFVPCHRIVRSDGTLGGYAFGLDTKQALLDHERSSATAVRDRAPELTP